MNKLLPIFTIAVLLGTNAYAACTINYACGTGATGTAPTSQSITDRTEVFTPSAPGECAKDGYIFTHWVVASSDSRLVSSGGIAYQGTEYTIPFNRSMFTCHNRDLTLTLTAQWFDEVSAKTPTSKSYVDAQLNGRQPQFANLGNNKLMLYGTTNGAVTSRDIVTTLGTSTTADSVPTRGAINTGLATKQNTLNGTAGWVVANTGAAGSVTQKPVYSTTDNYKTALVEADDLNTIITNAVNSELTEVEGIGWQINTANNLTLPTLRTLLPDAGIGGSGYCFRKLSGSGDEDSTCSAATLLTLGASGNKSGKWGAVMPYGDIVGKSVCSATQGTYSIAATDAQESGLTTEFNNQTGVGTSVLSDGQVNCWCKMESVDGYPAVSRWVFNSSYSLASGCADGCADDCGYDVQNNSAFRSAMFNTVQ